MPRQKLSTKERAEQRAMHKALAVGGGVLAMVGGAFALFLATAEFPRLANDATIAQRLDSANLTDFAFRLTGDGPADVLVIGSSDCVHCQRFTNDAMPTFVENMQTAGLTVDYLPLPTGPGSIVSSQILECLKGAQDPVAAVQATYTLSSEVAAGLDADAVLGRLSDIGQELGLSTDMPACWATTSQDMTIARGQNTSETFNLQGTPGFYVQTEANPEIVRQFSGYSSLSAITAQIENARGS